MPDWLVSFSARFDDREDIVYSDTIRDKSFDEVLDALPEMPGEIEDNPEPESIRSLKLEVVRQQGG